MFSDISTGIGYLIRGAKLIIQPGFRRFVAIPFVASVLAFLLIAGLLYVQISNWTIEITSNVENEWVFLAAIIKPILVVVGFLVSGYVSVYLVLLLTSPFHGALADKVEAVTTGEVVIKPTGVLSAIVSIPKSLLRELQKLGYYIPIALLVLILSFIPPFSLVSPLLWALLGAWMMSLQFLDYPMDNNGLPLWEVRRACASRRTTSLSFGALIAFLASIPLLNLFLIPAAVAGATIFWCEELRGR
jgi:CysZ protein